MIDIRKLKELVKLMVENDLAEIDLRDQEEKVTIRRGGSGPEIIAAPPVGAAAVPASANGQAGASDSPAPPTPPTPPASPATSGASAAPGSSADDGLIAIESPMVGTFYTSANPDSDPFVNAGSSVSEGSVICIVEAMKVFNEIKSEHSGTIERVCVKNGDPVEFGQPLFMLRPT